MIAPLKIRRDDPKNFARQVFDFLQSHGSSQLEDLSKSNLLALHIKASVNDAKVDIHSREIVRKFGNDLFSKAREDETFRHLKNVKEILDLYTQIQKFSNEGNTLLDLWIKLNSALILKYNLEESEMSALEYMGLAESESIYEMHDAQHELIQVYADRTRRLGNEEANEKASLWLDRFNREMYKHVCFPYLQNIGKVKSPEEFDQKWQRAHIPAMLKVALIDIESEKRQ